MTNREAIEELKKVDTLDMPAKLCEAHYMAIKALDQEPCGDAISRQAVIDGIKELKKSPWATDKRGNGFEYLIAEALDVVADLCVKQASSVNLQEPKTGYWKIFMHSAYHGIDDDGEPIWREVKVYHCNLCNRRTVIKENYCPNCGARMAESEDKE